MITEGDLTRRDLDQSQTGNHQSDKQKKLNYNNIR